MVYDFSNVSREMKEQHLEKVRAYRDQVNQNPNLRQLFLEMTLNCNQHCRHCGSKCGDVQMGEQLTDEEILNFLGDLKGKVDRLPFLDVTGGEPLIRPGFIELMHKIHKLGYKWGMTSNGTLMDEEMVHGLKYAGMSTISISLDGLEKTHDWFRQSEGGYQKAVKAIKMLSEAKFHHLMVTTVVHKKNVDELEEMYEVIKGLGVHAWRIINIDPIGRAKENKELLLEHEDYVRMLDFIKINRQKEKAFEICFGCNYWLGVENEHEFRHWYYKCIAGTELAGIFYNGDIGACLDIDRKPETIQGNIRKDDFMEIWKNKFEIYRYNKAMDSSKCSVCSEKENCRGGGFHTWNTETKQPELCLWEHYCN